MKHHRPDLHSDSPESGIIRLKGIPAHPAPSKNGAGHARSSAEVMVAGALLLAFLYFARPVLLPVILAAVAAMALKPLMLRLTRWGVPRVVGAILILGFFGTLLGFGFVRIQGPALQWIQRAPEYKAQLEQRLHKFFPLDQPAAPASANDNKDKGAETSPSSSPIHLQDFHSVLAWTGATLAGLTESVVLLFLLLVSGNWFSRKLVETAQTKYEKRLAAETIDAMGRKISDYLFTVTLINICLGVIVGVGLGLLHFPNAAMWGVMAALLNFMPYFGPIIGIAIVALVGILTLEHGFPGAILPAALYLVVHILEADVITPIFLGRHFTIHPLIIFVSLMFWTWIWGITGALLAVPILVALKVICARIPSFSSLHQWLTD